MRLYLILINVYFGSGCLISNLTDVMQMITDVVKSYQTPTSIVARVCWDPAIKLTFAKMLLSKTSPKLISFVNQDNGLNYLAPVKNDLFIVDLNCGNSKSFLIQSQEDQKLRKPYRWLLIDAAMNKNITISAQFDDLDILVDSEVLIAKETYNCEFILLSIYKINSISAWNIEQYGAWTKLGLNTLKEMSISTAMRRKNLNGVTIVISTIISDNNTKNLLEDLSYSNIFVDTPTKSSFRIMKPLYYFMNATERVIYTDKWGYNTNGTWNGMIGHLNNGEAELGGCVMFITKERLEILNYLIYPTPYKVSFVFRSPPLSYQNNLFLLPFQPLVWYCTAALGCILILILYVNAKWDMKKEKSKEIPEKNDATALRSELSDIFILVFSAISQQGCAKELKGTLGRLVIFILYLIFLFLYTSYSANIMALLQSTSNQIHTLNDLLNSKIEVGAEDVVYNRYYFATTTNPVRKAIYETKMATKGPTQNFMSLQEGVKKLQTQPFAFHMNTVIGYKIVEKYFQEHEKCGLQEIEYLQLGKPWLCSRKNTSFSEIYKIGFFRIQEHGLNDRENRLVYTKKPVCTGGGGTFGSVSMVDFYPVLLLLLYGATASILILIIEVLVHRNQDRYRR